MAGKGERHKVQLSGLGASELDLKTQRLRWMSVPKHVKAAVLAKAKRDAAQAKKGN
jgi:hypothetical protein